MNRTITVRGVGKIRMKPDWIILPIDIVKEDRDYARVLELSAAALEQLRAALLPAGFAQEDIRTQNFSVTAGYDNVRDQNGDYRRVFRGYECRHSLTISFAYDMDRLGDTLAALACCPAEPECTIQFTVQDQERAKNEMLAAAARDARTKAELLCTASGVSLGQLVTVDYNWNDVRLYSPSNLMASGAGAAPAMKRMQLEPEDVSASDSVSFIWEIE